MHKLFFHTITKVIEYEYTTDNTLLVEFGSDSTRLLIDEQQASHRLSIDV